MPEEQQTQVTPAELNPQDELRQAQEKLAAVKARLAEAEKLKLGALLAKVAAINAEKDRVAAEELKQREAIEQQWRDRRAREKEQEDANRPK